MIFDTPYDCTSANYSLKNIEQSVKLAMTSHELLEFTIRCHKSGVGVKLYLVTDEGMHSKTCPLFNHPIEVYEPKTNQTGLVVDMRMFGNMDRVKGQFSVRNFPDALWSLSRAVLTDYWINDDKYSLRDSSTLPMEIYASLLSQTISRRFNLDPGGMVKVGVLSSYFYHCLFEDVNIIDEVDLMKIAARIARANKLATQTVFDMVKDLGVLDTLENFCSELGKFVGDIRLEGFNVGVLLQIVTGNWIGNNSRENLAVALEHPPTWWSIVYFALNEASFSRSTLAKVASTRDKGGEGERFKRIYEQLVDVQALTEYLK